MPIYKTQNAAEISKFQKAYWHSKTPQERLAAALKLNHEAKALYLLNPNNPPLNHEPRILKSRTPIERRKR
jgi:hypothetical protein